MSDAACPSLNSGNYILNQLSRITVMAKKRTCDLGCPQFGDHHCQESTW